MDEIKAKYSKEVEGTDDERIQTIQEVAISSQNKLREMKVSFFAHCLLFFYFYLHNSVLNFVIGS